MGSRNDGFLGRGWSFPPTFLPDDGGVRMVEGEEDVRQALQVLLWTAVGERLFHPRFGCDIERYLFEPLTAGLRTRVRDVVQSALLYFEPRVALEGVRVGGDPEAGTLLIDLEYRVLATDSRRNLVLPYSLGGRGAER